MEAFGGCNVFWDPGDWRRIRNGTTHFAVIVGKRGFNYLVRDPGDGSEDRTHQLRQLVPQLEGLQLYQKIGR
jgi:hypothetical protein